VALQGLHHPDPLIVVTTPGQRGVEEVNRPVVPMTPEERKEWERTNRYYGRVLGVLFPILVVALGLFLWRNSTETQQVHPPHTQKSLISVP
jgi:hypothetical protein